MQLAKYLVLFTQISLDMVMNIAVGYLIGYGLDRLFKTESKVFAICFLIFGILSGFYTIYKRLSRLASEDDKTKRGEDK